VAGGDRAGKIGHFAGEARVTGVEDFVRINEAKQLTLLASLIHVLRTAASPCARAPTGVRRRSRWKARSTGGCRSAACSISWLALTNPRTIAHPTRLSGNGHGRWPRPVPGGISIRTLAAAIGLSPSWMHQLVAEADLDTVTAALGELRTVGWPAPEDPDSGRT